MRLDEALDALAEQARQYADPEAALRLSRRRRTRRVVTTVVAATVAIGVVLAVPLLAVHRRAVPAGPPGPSTSAVPRYPSSVTVPVDPPLLPRDRAVGLAAFAYAPSESLALLVTVDGDQYRLANAGAFHAGLVSLSPDGRWLVSGTELRDLTSTTVRTVPRGRVHWSPGSARALIDGSTGAQVVEVATGRARPIAGVAVAVLDNGDVIISRDVTSTSATLAFVDPVTGTERRHLTVDAAGRLHQDEGIAGRAGEGPLSLYRTWVSGTQAYLEVEGGHDLVLLVASLTDGQIQARLGVSADPPPYLSWAVAGIDSGRLVLRYDGPVASPGPGTPYALGLLGPDGGPPRIVTRFPAHSSVLARGGADPT